MATELTQAEQAHDLRAEEIEQEMIEDFNLFQAWFAEVFIVGNEAIDFHNYLVKGHVGLAGTIAGLAWEEHCKTKSYKQTGDI